MATIISGTICVGNAPQSLAITHLDGDNHQRHDLRRQSAAIISHHQQSRTLMASMNARFSS
jgi:hypothetical protein